MNALTLSATRRRKPIVILQCLDLSAGRKVSNTNILREASARIGRSLSAAKAWAKSRLSAVSIARALLSTRTAAVASCTGVLTMVWHAASIAYSLEAQSAIGLDCLLTLPFLLLWAAGSSANTTGKEGGAV